MGDIEPLSKWEATGYHTTHISNRASILSTGFRLSDNNRNTWLGEGVYFWADLNDAHIWSKIRFNSRNATIFAATISTDRSYVLDLRSSESIALYEEMYHELIKAQKRGSATFDDCHELDRAIIKALCLAHDWKVIVFADNWNQSPRYVKIRKDHPKLRSYVLDQNTRRRIIICVRDPVCIQSLRIVYDEVAIDETAATQDAGGN